jgi:tetratricopeptide (TPR) repeat protein
MASCKPNVEIDNAMNIEESPSPNPTREYWCFISYRHADNKQQGRQWATWLHQALESYEVPEDLVGTSNERGDEIPSRIYPVFRDEEELPADAELSAPISRALQNSRLMVVICSPAAVESKFVEDEIHTFKMLGKSDRVLAMMIRGEPNASEDAAKQRDGISAKDECFPLSLRRIVAADGTVTDERTEPVGADFRLGDGAEGWTSPEAYRQMLQVAEIPKSQIQDMVNAYSGRCDLMKLKIIAGILGVPLGVLTDREKAYLLQKARQRARSLQRWLAAVGLATCLAIAAGAFAFVKRQEAELARKRADTARQQAEELVRFMTFKMRDRLEGVGRLDLMDDINQAVERYHQQRTELMKSNGDALSGADIRLRSASYNTRGDLFKDQGNLSEAEKYYRKALETAEYLAARVPHNADLQRDLSVSHYKLGDLMKATGKLPEAETHYGKALEITETLAARDPKNTEWQRDLSVSHSNMGDFMRAAGKLPEAEKHYRQSHEVFKTLAALVPQNADRQRDLSVSINTLGDFMQDTGNLPEAEKHYNQSHEVFETLAARDPKNTNWQRDLSVSNQRLGDFMRATGNLPEAEKHYRKDLGIAETLAARDPDNADWQRDLSVGHHRMCDLMTAIGNLPEAEKHARQALEIAETLAARDSKNADWQRDLAVSHNNLGDFMKATDNLPEAEKHYRKDMEIAETLAARDPKNADWQRDLAVSHNNLGDFMKATDNLPEAEVHYRTSHHVFETLVARDPDSIGWQRDLSVSHNNLGDLMKVIGNRVEAEIHYRKALELTGALAARDPQNAEWQSDLAISHARLGDLMHATGNQLEAQKHCRLALDIRETLAAISPKNADIQRGLSACHQRMGDLMHATGNLPAAEKHYRKLLEIAETLATRDPKNTGWQRDLSIGYERLGDLMVTTGQLPAAEKHYHKALEIAEALVGRDKNNVDWQRELCCSMERLGLLAKQRGQLQEAREWLAKELTIADQLFKQSTAAESISFRINVLVPIVECDLALKDHLSAIKHQTRLVELRRHMDEPLELAEALFAQGQMAVQLNLYGEGFAAITESITVALKAGDTNPIWLSYANSALSWCATLNDKHADALAAGEKAVALLNHGKTDLAHMNCAHAYLFNGQFEKAKAIYAKYLGTAFEDGRKWNDELRNDFKLLREVGRDHPDMKKIEALLEAGK